MFPSLRLSIRFGVPALLLSIFRRQPLNRFKPSPGKTPPAGLSHQVIALGSAITQQTGGYPGSRGKTLLPNQTNVLYRRAGERTPNHRGNHPPEGRPYARRVCAGVADPLPAVFSCPDNRIPMALPCINGGPDIFAEAVSTSSLTKRFHSSI